MMRPVFAAALAALTLSAIAPLPAHAQEDKATITLIVPFPPAGSTDVLGRVLAQTMSGILKQPVIVENVGGAGGSIGATRAARARNDGNTLLFHNMAHASAPALYKSLPYHPIADFEPVGLVADVPMILVASKSFPSKDFKETLAYMKANGEKVKFAHAGIGATSQLCGMQLSAAMQVEPLHVPYKGTGPALNDIVAGHVDLLCDQPVSTSGHLKAGTLKAIAMASKTRAPTLPDVPTFSESGLPGFEMSVWHGLYAPKGTPQAAIDRLAAALAGALQNPMLAQKFAELGAEPVSADRATPGALRAHLGQEVERWGNTIRKAGIAPQ